MINTRRVIFVFGLSIYALLFLGANSGLCSDLGFTISGNKMMEEPTGDIVYNGDAQITYGKLVIVADTVRVTKADDSFRFGTISATGHVYYMVDKTKIRAEQIVIHQVDSRLPGWQRISASGRPVQLTHVPASAVDAITAEAKMLTWNLDRMIITLSGKANFRFRMIDVNADRIEYDEHLGLINGIRIERGVNRDIYGPSR